MYSIRICATLLLLSYFSLSQAGVKFMAKKFTINVDGQDHVIEAEADMPLLYALTNELDDTLDYILGEKKEIDLKMLLVSQINLPQQFLKLLDKEIENANAGKEASIILKLNNLQDKKMIRRLYKAADAGVKIELIIRGICCLVPRENIRIVRIIDRFLEHARVYIFHNSGDEKILIGSADWMERNLYRRIEVVFPILDTDVLATIKKNIQLQLQDNVKAVEINEKIENVKVINKEEPIRAQYAFYKSLKLEHDLKTVELN